MNQEYKIYKITYFLMAVNVITYLYTSLKYGLSMSAMQGIQVGGFNPLYVYYYHEYYRLITANFIHFGLMHIFCNVYSLYNLGMLMEKILKEKKYIIVIVVSMISTTLFSYLLFLLFFIIVCFIACFALLHHFHQHLPVIGQVHNHGTFCAD